MACKLQSLSWLRALCPASPKIGLGRHLGIFFEFFRILVPLFSIPKIVRNSAPPKTPPNLKSSISERCWFRFDSCLNPFRLPFFFICKTPWNKYFSNARFYLHNIPMLGTNSNQQLCFFRFAFQQDPGKYDTRAPLALSSA